MENSTVWKVGAACLLLSLQAKAVTIGIEDMTAVLSCVKVESVQLVKNGDVMWGGLPTWKMVKGSARVEPCPLSKGNWIDVPTEPLRSYQITVKVIRDSGERVLPPYFWFDNGKASPPSPPVILFTTLRRHGLPHEQIASVRHDDRLDSEVVPRGTERRSKREGVDPERRLCVLATTPAEGCSRGG